MKLEHSFDVQAPLERVWNALIDIEYVAPCLPGAAITGRDDDGSYRGTFTIKLGPTTAAYNGVLRIGEVDEAAHQATLHARGTDKRGQGGATATIVNTVSDAGGGSTHVQAVTDFSITGRLARFGRGGMMEDISNRLLGDFSRCLQEKLAAEGPEEQTVPEVEDSAALAGPAPAEEPAVPVPGEEPAVPTRAAEPAASAPEPGVSAPEPAVSAPGAEPAVSAPDPEPAAPGGPPPSAAPPGTPARAQAQVRPAPAPAAAKPVNGLALFFSVLWRRITRLVSARRKAH